MTSDSVLKNAKVIVDKNSPFIKSIILNKGRKEMIKKGQEIPGNTTSGNWRKERSKKIIPWKHPKHQQDTNLRFLGFDLLAWFPWIRFIGSISLDLLCCMRSLQ